MFILYLSFHRIIPFFQAVSKYKSSTSSLGSKPAHIEDTKKHPFTRMLDFIGEGYLAERELKLDLALFQSIHFHLKEFS